MRKIGKRFILCVLSIIMMFQICACGQDELKPVLSISIIENGQSNASIIVSNTVSEKVMTAARDLQQTLKEMSTVEVEILNEDQISESKKVKIFVGYSKSYEQFNIKEEIGYPENEIIVRKFIDNNIFLYGNDEVTFNGTSFAVTMLLSELGCGWYMPDDLWTVIPETKNISIPKNDIIKKPSFDYRQNRVLWDNPDLGNRWYLGGYNVDNAHGLYRIFATNETGYELGRKDLPDEFFSLIDGKRFRGDINAGRWQLCYSNSDVVDYTANYIINYFKENPTVIQYGIMQNDGEFDGGFCECSNCKATGERFSDRLLKFVNAVAKKVKPYYPNKYIMCGGYFPTFDAPSEKIIAEENVSFMLCRESSTYKSIAQAENEGYIDEAYASIRPSYSSKYLTSFDKNLSTWLETNPAIPQIWYWSCPGASVPEYKKIPVYLGQATFDDTKYFYEKGIKGVYFDQGPLEAYDGPNSYPLRWLYWYNNAMSIWDTNLTADEVLKDVCKKLFGDANDLMYNYYTALYEEGQKCSSRSHAWVFPKANEYYTESSISRLNSIIETIETKTKSINDEKVLQRIINQIDIYKVAKETIESI